MTNFSQMRKNMILGQFLPASIKNNKILKSYETLSRESFLPNHHKPIAYSDLNVKVTQKRYLPSPLNSAKIFHGNLFWKTKRTYNRYKNPKSFQYYGL